MKRNTDFLPVTKLCADPKPDVCKARMTKECQEQRYNMAKKKASLGGVEGGHDDARSSPPVRRNDSR